VTSSSDDFTRIFERWYEQDVGRLYNYLCYRLGDSAQAEDLTAAICERAVRNLDRYDPLQATFGAWMFGIARNELLHVLRDRKRRPAHLSLEMLPELESDGATVEE
jgi:RNA polymerase sigma-70 factor (ECF subfamily)